MSTFSDSHHRSTPSQSFPPNGRSSAFDSYGSSGTSEPTYELSVGETLQLHAEWALSGFMDSCRWDIVARIVAQDAEIRNNVIKSTLLNSISLIVIYAFDLFLVPLLGLSRSQIDMDEFAPEHWLHRNVGIFYTLLFQLPVVMGALYLNSSWSAVVAKRIYTLQHGRTTNAASSFSTVTTSHDRVLTTLSSNAYRMVLIMTSVTLSFVLGYIPIVGGVASFLFMCWVDAYYFFEFIWTSRGHTLPQRLQFEEERWSYFLAFGFSSAAVCMWGSSLANAALFALLFPGFVIMAIQAHPVPVYPRAPVPPSSRTNSNGAATGDSYSVQPNPIVPVRLPIFAVPLIMHDIIQRFIITFGPTSGGGGGGGDMRAGKASDISTWLRILGIGSGSSSSTSGYGYGGSSSIESIEEGAGEAELEKRYGGFGSGGASTSGVWRGGGLRNTNGNVGNGFSGGAAPYAASTRLRTKKLD